MDMSVGWEDRKCTQNFGGEIFQIKPSSLNQGDGRITLRWILGKYSSLFFIYFPIIAFFAILRVMSWALVSTCRCHEYFRETVKINSSVLPFYFVSYNNSHVVIFKC
jgi:hypothetical protein